MDERRGEIIFYLLTEEKKSFSLFLVLQFLLFEWESIIIIIIIILMRCVTLYIQIDCVIDRKQKQKTTPITLKRTTTLRKNINSKSGKCNSYLFQVKQEKSTWVCLAACLALNHDPVLLVTELVVPFLNPLLFLHSIVVFLFSLLFLIL